MSAANEAVIGIAIIIYSLITSCLVLSLHTHFGENGLRQVTVTQNISSKLNLNFCSD